MLLSHLGSASQPLDARSRRLAPATASYLITNGSGPDSGQRAEPAIPPIGADESSARLVVQGPERIAKRRARGRALDHDLARLQNQAPEGWPPLAAHASALTPAAGVSVRSVAEAECAPTPTWPGGPKPRSTA
jgi:hypothetical protein